jgi:hypothetical protein
MLEIEAVTGKMCLSVDEHGFNDVIADIPNATYIYITTYNVSNKDVELISSLNYARSTARIKIITNLPSYNYNRKWNSEASEATLNSCLEALNQVTIENYDFYFNLNNHAKIVMTNNVAYIGSANFSVASARNYECGILIRDIDKIEELTKVFFLNIEANSIPYKQNEWLISVMNWLNSSRAIFDDIFLELESRVYSTDPRGRNKYFDYTRDDLCEEDIDELVLAVETATSDLSNYTQNPTKGTLVKPSLLPLLDALNAIKETAQRLTIKDLCDFNTTSAGDILGDYATSFQEEEGLEEYHLRAQFEASERLEQILLQAEDDLNELFERIQQVTSLCSEAILTLDALATRHTLKR